jgi:MoxR-like ATPase
VSWPDKIVNILKRLQTAEQTLADLFVDRTEAVKLMVLASVCGEHLLLLGPPGTGKTDLVTRFTRLVQATTFQYLITRFTEPSEVFGPLDLKKFNAGHYHIATAGMLPEAEIAFLDEVFQGNSAILNGFLAIINERVFHNGSERQPVPLITMIGASNDLPDDPVLRAFADRFLLRTVVNEVPAEHTGDLLARGWEHETERLRAPGGGAQALAPLNVADLQLLRQSLAAVKLDGVRAELAAVVTERRVVRAQKLVAAAALQRKADRATTADLWPLRHIWTRPDDQPALDQVLAPRLKAAGGSTGPVVRPAEEVATDLEQLAAQEKAAATDTQIHALLTRYNTLRREIERYHKTNGVLTARVRDAIQRLMNRLSHREGS